MSQPSGSTSSRDEEEIEELKAADAKEVHRAVREEGEEEVNRPAASLLWSGLAAGFAINASLLAEAALHTGIGETPWRTLVVSLGYPLGFVIVILGRMQFFTESTITAMLPLVTRPSMWTLKRTLRLWALVILANLAGTALTTLALTHLPMLDASLRDGMVSVSEAILHHDAIATFWTAIPAGFMIASIAWMLPNAREQSFLVIFAVTYAVGVTGLSHSVVGSAEAFTLVWAGKIDIGRALFVQIAPAVIGNLVGGAGLFAVLAHGQVRPEMPDGGSDQ
ncbi:Formate/nitrite transporter FocA, FNT family [Sphingomonas palmae]|uniref:Formate/nitrite transporter FocA, FNT family n=1 Tax=Sphingomonas palmae TaxID=1855283 RepID=A0A1H7HNB5_9SPHN|nr:formate/nitrite transporter family protein [Sphingomonas palmae]SEK51714.1 Formate/nitrite transporter FocA, FNT family [Sphingomonas palmae]